MNCACSIVYGPIESELMIVKEIFSVRSTVESRQQK
jgi:hypothetical protein